MDITDSRKLFETSKYLKTKLLNKEIPSLDDITNMIRDLEEDYDLSQPILDTELLSVVDGDKSSASKFNQTQQSVQDNVEVAYQAIGENVFEIDNTYNTYINRLSLLLSKTKKLESRVKSLLISNSLSDGYYDILDEPIVSMDQIDQENTTAQVDLESHSVHIQENTSIINTSSRYYPTLNNSNIKFNVLNKASLISESNISGQGPLNAFTDSNIPWLHRIVYSKSDSPLVCELKVDLGSNIDLSKIVFKKNMPGELGIATLQILYSIDNTSYYNISNTQEYALSDNIIAIFSKTTVRYLKFIITKYYYDQKQSSSFVYFIGIKDIALYSPDFNQDNGNIFQSKLLGISDGNGGYKNITKVACEVCQNTDDYNTIDYSISFDDVNYYPISPYSTINPEHPTNISVVSTIEETASELSLATDVTNWKYSGKSNLHNIPISGLDTTDVIEEELLVYRGVGQKGYFESSSNTQDISFCYSFEGMGIPKGWLFDGTYYSSVISVLNSEGLSIDFGSNTLLIDGLTVNGTQTISQGDHLVKITPENFKAPIWSSETSYAYCVTGIKGVKIDGTLRTNIKTIIETDGAYVEGPEQEATLVDPLFPYNHRLLIEGLPYTTDYPYSDEEDYNQIYSGVGRFSAYKCSRLDGITFNQLEDNQIDKYFISNAQMPLVPSGMRSLKTPVLKDNDDNIFLPTESNIPKRQKELFTVVSKSYDENHVSATGVIFRAVLKSTNNSSPVFGGFRLKLATKD